MTATELLDAWELGVEQGPVDRALTLLQLGAPIAGDPARTSIGVRDTSLMRLRRCLFGSVVEGTCACPGCDETIELSFDLDDVLAKAETVASEETRSLEGGTVRYRLPTSQDLLEALAHNDDEDAKAALLACCVLESPTDESVVSAAVIDAMAEAEPLADIVVAASCPACERSWTETFDIGSFLWAEIGAWRARSLSDIHALASAYGWSEEAIVALPHGRRRAYLELVDA